MRKMTKDCCEDCGASDGTVRERNCPFDEDVRGVITKVMICDDCERKRADDI